MNREEQLEFSQGAERDGTVVRLILPDRAALDALLLSGVDLAEYRRESDDGVEVHAIVTAAELAVLQEQGYVAQQLWSDTDWAVRTAQRAARVAHEQAVLATVDTITVSRICYSATEFGAFLHLEAATSAGSVPNVILTASWDSGQGTQPGPGGSAPLARLTTAGEYQYHRMVIPVSVRPAEVTVSSSLGGKTIARVADWPDDSAPGVPTRHYVTDFISHYMDPTELYERIEALAREFPALAEIVRLPVTTDGYQRKAQAILGTAPDAAVVVTSQDAGYQGANVLAIELVDPGAPNQPLSVSISGDLISVRLGTDAAGKIASTAAQVSAALSAQAGNRLEAQMYRGSAGAGLMVSQAATPLTDNLKGPKEVARGPFELRALRIGTHRDGSRPGVMVYAQEHAREWVTPLVAVEAAERLLRNYGHDAETAQLIDGADTFIIPCVNPDGAHYSFYDYSMQRKNMVAHTGNVHAVHADPQRRNFWGVDPNRNWGVGSVFDGYIGASTNCLSQIYAGPAKLSEAESRNLLWLAEQYPSIKYSLNMHSYGGYVMWVPGAYKGQERTTLERPSAEQEAVFRSAADQMAAAIKERRGTVIPPGQIGPGADVMYSAAGNSSDHLWYGKGIISWEFEVGADVRDPGTGSRIPAGFQPPFEEGHEEAMEWADGLIALIKFAKERAQT